MASGNLYNETLRSAMREPRPEPRESKAWLAWLLLGMMAGGSIMGTWDMYQERYREADRGAIVRTQPSREVSQ